VSVEEIATAVGISRQSMSDIENGKSLPRYGTPGDLLKYEDRRALQFVPA
jgi:transcriptional regulator with XRE-family HTH domain